MTEKTMSQVSSLFARGFAPSQIDKMLKLEDGTAHDAMLEVWAANWDMTGATASTERILDLFERKLAPSQIDRRLGLAAGTAHDAIVESWAADSRRNKGSQNAAKALDLLEKYRCA